MRGVIVDLLRTKARRLIDGRARVWLTGAPIGHRLHPLLTDLPIGFWTSSWTLDLLGGKRSQRASDLLMAAGIVAAIPTAAAGLADWSDTDDEQIGRTGLIHAAANTTATGLYVWALGARLRGDRRKGFWLAQAAATAATVGGSLGGHMTHRLPASRSPMPPG